MKRTNRFLVSLIFCFTFTLAAHADDIDIYLDPAVPSGAEPLVMFSLDYRSNLGSTACGGSECDTLIAEGYLPSTGPYTRFDVLRAVLKKVLDPLEGVKIGFMMNHDNANNCEGPQSSKKCSNGGYMLSGLRSLMAGDSNGAKANLHAKLGGIPVPQGNVSHSYQGKELFLEFFRYLTGQGVYNGHNGWTDYGTNSAQNLPAEDVLRSWDDTIETSALYDSPLVAANQCTKIFTINIMFQVSNQEDDSDNAITETKANGGMGGINLSGNNNSFDTVIRYLKDADLGDGTFGPVSDLEGVQNVVSYFIVDPTKINNTTTGYANAGGTGVPLALSDNPDELVATLNNIFKSILSVSTTFVAPSVPVNVFNRAQTVNEVFIALFEADENGYPLWPGNLKKLRIGVNGSTGRKELQDTSSINAIDIDGRIKREAVTYWTRTGDLPAPQNDEVAGADGRSIPRGGAGQIIPGFVGGNPGASNSDSGARQAFTQDPNDATDGLMPLNADTTTADALWTELSQAWNPTASDSQYSNATSAEQDKALNILRFARGLEDDGSTTRQWVMGDPLHSRPRPINYGATGGGYDQNNPNIRILMGTNDGFMRMFRNTDSTGQQDGAEMWAFTPREVIPVMDRLRLQAAGNPKHPYTVDGSPVVFKYDANSDGNFKSADGDKVYAYFGLRRGGKYYYAMDISDPDSPKLLWTIKKGAAGTDFAELGQSWSKPQLGHVNLSNTVTPVLVFGGGYNGDDDGDDVPDLGKDAKNRATRAAVVPTLGTDDDEGNAIFMVDATNGALIWKAVKGTAGYDATDNAYKHPDLNDSIAAEVAAVDTDGDGLLDRIYAGDTSGVLWRADLAGYVDDDNNAATPDILVKNDKSAWTVTKLFSSGRHTTGLTGIAHDRRFFIRPDVVQSRDGVGPFDGVLIGSGDRADPNGTDVENWFYMIKDRHTSPGLPSSLLASSLANLPSSLLEHADLVDLSDNCLQDDSCGSPPDLANGWRIQLADTGEKNLAAAVTVGGAVYFSTFAPTPPAGMCSLSEGRGRLYVVSLQKATAVVNFDTTNDNPGDPTYERYDFLASGGIPVEVVPLGQGLLLVQGQETGQNIMTAAGRTSFKTYWHELYE